MSLNFRKSKNENDDCMNCYYCSDTCRECVGTNNIAKKGWVCDEWKNERQKRERREKTKKTNKPKKKKPDRTRRGWAYLLDKKKYSAGPSDNIYVYG